MKKSETIANMALRTLAAVETPSVVKVFKGTIVKMAKAIDEGQKGYYIGVKDTDVISSHFLSKLEDAKLFVHTKDMASQGGRAVDLSLTNPITGRYMTGSSSGTAINVFLDINDLGVGTDGGGSVLAPALSLNLYAMISPLIDQHSLRKYSKVSTDGILFSPSIGFISKDINLIEYATKQVLDLKESDVNYTVNLSLPKVSYHQEIAQTIEKLNLNSKKVKLNYDGLNRNQMMQELKHIDFDQEILITYEGPIDLLDYGDSVMGHYDSLSKSKQENGHKYYLKVINMLGLSAIVVPSNQHACGYCIICKSDQEAIYQAFQIAKTIPHEQSPLEATYFNCANALRKDTL